MARQATHDRPLRLPDTATRGELLARLDEAVRAARARPGSAIRRCNEAFLLLRLDRRGDALEAAAGAVRAEPGNADAHVVHGIALHSLGRVEEALGSYARAIEIDPGRADAHCNRGAALMRLGRYGEALGSLDRAAALDPKHPDAHVGRGRSLFCLGRNDEAVRALRRAVSLKHDDAQVWFDIGAILFRMGRLPKSLAAFETAVKVGPNHARAHYARGLLLHRLGRQGEAAESLGEAGRLDPGLAAPDLTATADDVYLAWNQAREIRNRLETPTGPTYVGRNQIRLRLADFLNAARRTLEYHKSQHNSKIMDDYHGMDTIIKEYLQHVNQTKHEGLLDVHIEKTGKMRRVFHVPQTGQPAIIIEDGGGLSVNGRTYNVRTCPDDAFRGDVSKGYLYEVQTCHVQLKGRRVELIEFLDTILRGVMQLLKRHGYDTSGLNDASYYYEGCFEPSTHGGYRIQMNTGLGGDGAGS